MAPLRLNRTQMPASELRRQTNSRIRNETRMY